MSEAWYQLVPGESRITQGDIIFDCPVTCWKAGVTAPAADADGGLLANIEALATDVVVMSQACDLEHDKVTNVILCPHQSLADFKTLWETTIRNANQNPTAKAWKAVFGDLREGQLWNLSLLNSGDIDGSSIQHRVVDFHEVFSVPRPFLETFCRTAGKPRFQLKAPYREHLSQAFARFFMRVGLPTPINE